MKIERPIQNKTFSKLELSAISTSAYPNAWFIGDTCTEILNSCDNNGKHPELTLKTCKRMFLLSGKITLLQYCSFFDDLFLSYSEYLSLGKTKTIKKTIEVYEADNS